MILIQIIWIARSCQRQFYQSQLYRVPQYQSELYRAPRYLYLHQYHQRYKGYVYVPVEELVSNETQPTNTNPENGKPQRQRRPPKKCLEFVYD